MGGTVGSDKGARAFIGSFTTAGGHGVTAAAVDEETGALVPLGSSAAVANPSFLAPSPDGRVLYAVGETSDGTAAAFDITGPVPVLLAEPVPVDGAGPTHLALGAGHLLTANYDSGSVTALAIRPDGALDRAVSVLAHHGSGPDPDRQREPHAHQVLPDPSGRWIVSVDLGTDSVRVCALTRDTGALRLHSEAALRPGSGPRHLAFHPDGRHAYVLNELAPTLTVCRWDAEEGRLEPLGENPVVEDGASGEIYPSEVVVGHDGRFLWAANRGHDSLAVLALDEGADRPRFVTTVGCGGHWPRDLTLDPSGRRLYASNERSGDVTWFSIDPATGIPARAGSIEAPAASCVVFR
ncbi:lactonase family protein [Streptomyces sp. NBC_00083]|uniref:lactonase family protein n=1 Tax=Streptomyces sp. NBC_00083 TaxID=2975647 RepID=UPI00225AACC7|nr:lactonase family protein [Streptomyces sp. NBC_00083]MCX5383845.1 lactonase family protein [Streptomyces sp. NBC_00083]